ncbi:hypothetical protein DH2020_022590 [Rehmannia glutinosa]|uniref:Chlorophyll a-b binding protein, chloroplastic n=1 Tax=Rehmannia glutinosa TaxID=99300 RepID=A0ABR0W7H3_REHGL
MALVSSSSICSSAEAARQILGGRPTQSSSRKVSFVVKAASTPPVKQGADRPLWFASKQSLSYLDGSLPGDYGFDPLGLSDPKAPVGSLSPNAGTYNYWADNYTLFVLEMALMGFAEHRRFRTGPSQGPWANNTSWAWKRAWEGLVTLLTPGPIFQSIGVRERREVYEGVEAEGSEEWEIGYVGNLGLLYSGPCDWCWPIPKPAGPFG